MFSARVFVVVGSLAFYYTDGLQSIPGFCICLGVFEVEHPVVTPINPDPAIILRLMAANIISF